MPTAEQILTGLQDVANTWKIIAVFWHVYFGAMVLVLASGIRPPRRIIGLLLGLPSLSVSVIAWLASNPFNGTVFAIVGLAFLYAASRLKNESIRIGSKRPLVAGIALFFVGWIYPHFLHTTSYFPYLYAAPIGTIPCPTLLIVIGSMLMLDGLGSRSHCIILSAAGCLYGLMGVLYLHVALDWVLILAAVILLVYGWIRRWNPVKGKREEGIPYAV